MAIAIPLNLNYSVTFVLCYRWDQPQWSLLCFSCIFIIEMKLCYFFPTCLLPNANLLLALFIVWKIQMRNNVNAVQHAFKNNSENHLNNTRFWRISIQTVLVWSFRLKKTWNDCHEFRCSCILHYTVISAVEQLNDTAKNSILILPNYVLLPCDYNQNRFSSSIISDVAHSTQIY